MALEGDVRIEEKKMDIKDNKDDKEIFKESLSEIIRISKEVRREIIKKLEDENVAGGNSSLKINGSSNSRDGSKYEIYQWITLEKIKEEGSAKRTGYCISMHSDGDKDSQTNNAHVFLGEIQFEKLKYDTNTKRWSPMEESVKESAGKIYDDGFTIEKVVSEFKKYIEENKV